MLAGTTVIDAILTRHIVFSFSGAIGPKCTKRSFSGECRLSNADDSGRALAPGILTALSLPSHFRPPFSHSLRLRVFRVASVLVELNLAVCENSSEQTVEAWGNLSVCTKMLRGFETQHCVSCSTLRGLDRIRFRDAAQMNMVRCIHLVYADEMCGAPHSHRIGRGVASESWEL